MNTYFFRVIVKAVSLLVWATVLLTSLVVPGYAIWQVCGWLGVSSKLGENLQMVIAVIGSVIPDLILFVALKLVEDEISEAKIKAEEAVKESALIKGECEIRAKERVINLKEHDKKLAAEKLLRADDLVSDGWKN